ncbi:glutaredoxin domain-containing protein [Chloroflexota bacterium]
MVKEFLSQRGIGFQERDVSRNQVYAQELMKNTGQMGVPVTIINQQTVVGFDRARLEQLITQIQAAQCPSFGASIADASKITAKQGSGITLGAYIGRVRPGSVANRLGLASGDIIIELNMRNIANASDLERALSSFGSGNRIALVFLRGNKKMTTQGIY